MTNIAKTIAEKKLLKELPTILSFTRNLEPSDALMYSGKWDNKEKDNSDIEIKVRNKSVDIEINGEEESVDISVIANRQNFWRKIVLSDRKNLGTKSQYKLTKGSRTEGNPVEGDKASLFDGDDTLKVSFMLKVLGNIGEPTACNEPSYEEILTKRFNLIKEQGGLKKLAQRYAYNIANARFLFRNRVNAEEIMVYVKNKDCKDDKDCIEFNAYDFSVKNFDKNSDNKDLALLSEWIEQGLSGTDRFTLLEIIAYAKIGNRSQVYPSQEMNTNEKRKTLFQLEGCAGIHDVKLGNAIRTIDTWYKDDDNKYQGIPFAIEPFGAIIQKGDATRDDNETNLYAYLKKLPVERKSDEIDDMDLFFVANLIRGGLFQGESKKK